VRTGKTRVNCETRPEKLRKNCFDNRFFKFSSWLHLLQAIFRQYFHYFYLNIAMQRRTQIGQQYDALERAEATATGARRRAADRSLEDSQEVLFFLTQI
jgi:hypothetical protein